VTGLVLALVLAAPVHAQSGGTGASSGDPLSTSTSAGSEGVGTIPRVVPGLGDEISQGMRPLGGIGPDLAGAINPKEYIVGPGDVLMLLLWGKVSRSMTLEVGPEGVVLLPGAGTFRVDGLTLAEVQRQLLERMAREFRGVNMDVRLVVPRQFRVYVTGQVKNAGPLAVRGGSRVTDALTPAMMQDNGSRRRVEVLHKDGTREIADLDLFDRTGTTSANPFIRDGDVINVPVLTDFLYADGAVARPGRYELGPDDSLLTLFRLVGDPLPAADAERALLIRWRQPFQPESLWFGLDEVYSRRVNPVLREGDRLYVFFIPQYHLQHEATIIGEVARPGVYPIQEGVHKLSDIVTSAGGFLPGADLSAIRVSRRGTGAEKDPELDRMLRLSRNEMTASEYEALRTKLANLKEEYRVDWNRLMAAKEDLDLLLRDGDVVRVERLVSSVRVDGEVNRPGFLRYEAGQTVEDYVRQAGGYTNRAWKSKVRVSRSVTGQTLVAKNVRTLDPGDLVWVPEKPDRDLGRNIAAVLIALAQVATIVIAIDSINNH
jgi:protein involved in polysaccharide export with SLBB domain